MKNSFQIDFDPMFVEEAVFLLLRDQQREKLYRDFCSEKEGIYQKGTAPAERDGAFQALYRKYFQSLGLEKFFDNICGDFPHLDQPQIRTVVKRVWDRKYEEAELYVRPHQKTIYLGILVRRVLSLALLESFLRHELMRIADMLALSFRYTPHPALGGKNEIENNLIRERFRLLWDFYIDVRLRGKEFKTVTSYEDQKEEFGRKFFFLTVPEREQILRKMQGGESLTQIDLLSWAGDPRSVKVLGEGGLRCPLCDFTSFNPMGHWDAGTVPVVNEIKKDHPHWDPSQGICPQCFDIYGLKTKAGV